MDFPRYFNSRILFLTLIALVTLNVEAAQESIVLYPQELDQQPTIDSPGIVQDGTETITVRLKNGKYSVIPVTVENGQPLDFRNRRYGKGNQLKVDAKDFPELAKTGWHDEKWLSAIETITGKPVDTITGLGRPRSASGIGFMAEDEDIISVLIGDNRLAKRLGLTHAQLAKPLFHILNMVLLEYNTKGLPRFICAQVDAILYNGQEIQFKGEGSRGFQESIFDDEILGNATFDIERKPTDQELEYLKKQYAHLSQPDFDTLCNLLTHIRTAEMEPFFIMRYGFFEGHTGYRTDPISIAFIFGLKSLEDIDKAFEGKLNQALTGHFTKDTIK